MGDFKVDLEKSKPAVDEFCAFLNSLYANTFGVCTVTKGYDTKGDTYSPKKDLYFEVKHDLQADTTGNFFIEVGGLEKSGSAFYVYVDGSNYYITNTEKLRELCKGRRIVMGGDNKSFEGWLIRREEMKKISSIYPRRSIKQ